MAKQMSYQTAFGETYAQSYWRPVQVNLGQADKTANIVFYGYKDKAARDGSKAPVGMKTYSISGADYDTYFADTVLKTKTPLTKAYDLAVATEDSGGKSFFDGATDV